MVTLHSSSLKTLKRYSLINVQDVSMSLGNWRVLIPVWLKCSSCPQTFCGFCYEFAGDWGSTHDHVRHCKRNPRVNYFVESEVVWRGLMRERRLRLAEERIGREGGGLSPEQIDYIREKINLYL